jgi:hypothetical protein
MTKISPERKAAEDGARRFAHSLDHELGSFRIISRDDDVYWGAACRLCGAEVTYLASDPENTVGGLPMFQKCRVEKVPSATR